MKRATLIALMAVFLAPAAVLADPGHPALYQAYEWLHYFSSFRHVTETVGGIVLAIVVYKVVRHFAKPKKIKLHP